MYTFSNVRGFTLIEVLVYLALYSIIIGGAVVAAYGMFESSGHNQTKAMVEEEGGYLLSKIEWALSSGDNSLVFDVAEGNMRLARGTAVPEILNNSNISVSNFYFTNNGTTSFTLSARTPQGSWYSEDFSVVNYPHQ